MIKNLPANEGDSGNMDSVPGSGRSSWGKKWQPILVFLPGKSSGQRSLAGDSPHGLKELDTPEHTTQGLQHQNKTRDLSF